MNKSTEKLLNHPFWDATDPDRQRLIRASKPLPPELNPFADDGVVLTVAGVPGDAKHVKSYLGRAGIRDGIERGEITPETTVVEASSGNTGQSMAETSNAVDLGLQVVVPDDVAQDKLNAMRVYGGRVELILHSSKDQSTVERARELGAQPGFYNPDQYSRMWNPYAHRDILAPQLFRAVENISLIFAPGGTMGTAMGMQMYAGLRGLRTKVVPVLCKEGEEVPGARSLKKVLRDVRLPWRDYFSEVDIEYGTAHESFLLSHRSWRHVPQMLGPTFGLAYYGALKWLSRHKQMKLFDRVREADGTINAVIFGPDDARLYLPLYFRELKAEERAEWTPVTLESIGLMD